MKPDIKNIKASVKGRLLEKAKEAKRPYSEVLQYYAMERFLYRFSQSNYAEKFILKGALMFTAWNVPARRTTVDIDFLGRIDNKVENVENAVRDICKIRVVPDGLDFDEKTVKGLRIKEDADYEGVRVKFLGFLERAKIPMQIDIGFGDIVLPEPSSIDYPTILNFPAPRLQGYSFESVVAEKFEAMVKLGLLNSRMKDFYDIWLMTRQMDFDGRELAAAIKATFKCRETPLPAKTPFFAEEIYDEKSGSETMWEAFVRKKRINNGPENLAQAARSIEVFLSEPVKAITAGMISSKEWHAPGPWK